MVGGGGGATSDGSYSKGVGWLRAQVSIGTNAAYFYSVAMVLTALATQGAQADGQEVLLVCCHCNARLRSICPERFARSAT